MWERDEVMVGQVPSMEGCAMEAGVDLGEVLREGVG